MKRLIALLLFICLSLNMAVCSVSGSTSTDEYTMSYKYKRAAALLKELEVYDGIDAFAGANGFVRRDVFALVVAKIMGLNDPTGEFSNRDLLDVKKGHFAYSAINQMLEAGIMSETLKGFFSPDSYVTYQEAVKALVIALGYQIQAESKGGTEVDYMAVALSIGLTSGTEQYRDNRIQLKFVTTMLYNALLIDVLRQRSYGTNNGYSSVKGENLLYETFDVYEIKGIITANEFTSIDLGGNCPKGMVRINGVMFRIGATKADNFIGYYVYAYCKQGEDDADHLLLVDSETKNNTLVLNSEDTIYSNFTYRYAVENSKTEERAMVSDIANIIYNGKATGYKEKYMRPEMGEIVLIDNDGDDRYDTVKITSIKNMVVQDCNFNEKRISFKYGAGVLDLNSFENNAVEMLSPGGKAFKLSALNEWDVLSVAECTDGKELKIHRSTDKISGIVDSTSSDGNATVLTIDGKEYKLAASYPNKLENEIKVGSKGVFYFDMFGKIAAFKEDYNTWRMAYLVDAKQSAGIEKKYNLKIFSEENNGKMITLSVADRVYIDGIRCNYEGISRKDASNMIETILNNTSRLIRYKTNSNNQLAQIDTVLSGDDTEGSLYVSYPKSSLVYRSSQFMGKVAMNDATKIFVIPTPEDDVNDERFYKLVKANYFIVDRTYSVESYGISENDMFANAIVCTRMAAIGNAQTLALVSNVSVMLGNEGESVDAIKVLHKGKEVLLKAREEGFLDTKGIEKGDLIRYTSDEAGYIDSIEVIYDLSADVLSTVYAYQPFNGTCRIVREYAYRKGLGILRTSTAGTTLVNEMNYMTGGKNIMVYDSSNPKQGVRAGTEADIADFVNYGFSDQLIIHTSYQEILAICIYK